MRRLFSSALHSLRVTISRRALRLERIERRWRGQSVTVLADVSLGDDAGHAALAYEPLASGLRAALKRAQCRRMSTHIVLADELVRYFMVTPPQNAGSLRDCRAAAQMRFQSLYGEATTAWQIQADWDARVPFLACAIPTSFLNALQAVLADRQLALAELTPRFVAAWNRSHGKLHDDAWLGVVHERGMTVGAIHDGRLRAVRSLDGMPEDFSAERLHGMIAREALLLNLPMPSRLQLSGASLVAATTTSSARSVDTLTCENLDEPHAEMPT